MEIIVEKPENLIPCCDSWQQIMKSAVRDTQTLLEKVQLPELWHQFTQNPSSAGNNPVNHLLNQAENQFPVFVPQPFLNRIEKGNPEDPILKQVLAVPQESDVDIQKNYVQDPLQELSSSAQTENGIIKKYKGRALLMTTGACGVHCRYCFRRHFPYQHLPKNRRDWSNWLRAVSADPTIKEVILSGGDPLVLTDQSLMNLSDGLSKISHARWIRIHSRMPVVIPQRITDQFLSCFQSFQAKTFVIHCNHEREIDNHVAKAIGQLKNAGWQVLNQAVLLKDINDSKTALIHLSEKLIEAGALPYYLHQLDPVYGAAHFNVPAEHGIQLIHEIRKELPGHAVPRFVVEQPGEPNKTVLA